MTNKTSGIISVVRNRIIAGLFVVVPLGITLWLGYFIFDKLSISGLYITTSILDTLEKYNFFTSETTIFIHDLEESLIFNIVVRLISLLIIISSLYSIGVIAKWTVGRKLISVAEQILMKVPMLNIVYSTIQQIGEAIWSPKGGMFRKVVLFEYPRKDIWVIGFLTNENDREWELDKKTNEELLSIFLPTTPNPTSGFLLFVPKKDCIVLDMDITEAMRLVISGGAVPPQAQFKPTIIGGKIKVFDTLPDKTES